MPWSRGDIAYSHLFIAAPELFWEEEVTSYLIERGLISGDAIKFIASVRRNRKRFERIRDKAARHGTIIQRILAVAPEALNLDTIDLLANTKIIGKRDAHILRLAYRALGAVGRGGLPSDRDEILRRARHLFGVGLSEETISLLRSIDAIDLEQAQKARAVLLSGGVTVETLAKVRRAKTLADILALVGSGILDKRMIQAMRLTGIMDGRTANALVNAISYGRAQWTVWEGSKRAEGLAARLAYVASGSFSFEALDVLKALGYLTPDQEKYLLFAIQVSQRYNRELMEQFTERKYRVVSGEAPIATYSRASKETDSALLRLLAEASDNASKEASKLSGVRGAQYAIQARQLHVAMRQVWEGVGYLTIFGEHKVADAAIQSTEMLQGVLRSTLPDGAARMLEYQARASLDSYVSRKENTLQLSKRVYGNLNLWTGKVDRTINLAILQGKSAKEIANDVRGLIDPRVSGGVKYAAMRLGRTELANAFHNTTIRHTREMPWVQGYKWSRSSSHGHADICDQYANNDHDGLGPGIFKKANVPQKPHPQCMCYITAEMPDEKTFKKNLNSGLYNRYLQTMKTDADLPPSFAEKLILGATGKAAGILGQVALTKGLAMGEKMLENGRAANFGFNPVKVTVAQQTAHDSGADFFPNHPVFAAMVDDVNKGRKSLDEEPLSSAEIDGIAKALKRNEKKLSKAGTDLGMRQTRFRALLAEEKKVGASFDKTNYDETLPDIWDNDVLQDRTDFISHYMYGTRAYRSINANLRAAKGVMKDYDTKFVGKESFFEDIAKLNIEDWDAMDNFSESLKNATVDLDKNGDEAHYWISMRNLFPDFLAGNGHEIQRHSDVIRNLDKRMEPTTVDAFNYRVAGSEFFGLGRDITFDDVGHVFKEYAYTSTEGIKSYFGGETTQGIDVRKRSNRIRILTPKGTMAARMNDEEFEILLSRGTKFQIMGVRDLLGEAFSKEVDIMVVGQDKLANHKKFMSSDASDMLDELMKFF